ncbi:MAG: hypothetical protein Q9217_001208 [Psora testacea]
MDIAQLQARLKLMGSEITICHQTVESLNNTILTQIEQIKNLQRHDYKRQGELELKESELAVYYKHMAKLQDRLEKANNTVGATQAKLDATQELNRKSLQCVERYQAQIQDLEEKLDEARKKTRLSDIERLTEAAEQFRLKNEPQNLVMDAARSARANSEAKGCWPMQGSNGVNESFGRPSLQSQLFKPLADNTNSQDVNQPHYRLIRDIDHQSVSSQGPATSRKTKLNPESAPFTPTTVSKALTMGSDLSPALPHSTLPIEKPVTTTAFTPSSSLTSMMPPPPPANSNTSTPFHTPVSGIRPQQKNSAAVKSRLPPHLRALTPAPKKPDESEGLSSVTMPANGVSKETAVTPQPPTVPDAVVMANAVSKEEEKNAKKSLDEATQLWLALQFQPPEALPNNQSPTLMSEQLIDYADEATAGSAAKDPTQTTDVNKSEFPRTTPNNFKAGAIIQKTDVAIFQGRENNKEDLASPDSSNPQPRTVEDKEHRVSPPRFEDLQTDEKPRFSVPHLATPFYTPAHSDPAAFVKDFNSKLPAFTSKWLKLRIDATAKEPQYDQNDDDELEEGEIEDGSPTKHSTTADREGILQVVPNGMAIPQKKASQEAKISPIDDSASVNTQAAKDILLYQLRPPPPTGTRTLGEAMDEESRALVLKPSTRFKGKRPEAKDLNWKKVTRELGGKTKECYVL